MERILTFEDLLNEEDYIICDTGACSIPKSDWYNEGICQARNLSGIDTSIVSREIELLSSYIEFLSNEKVYVTCGVLQEMKNLDEAIGYSRRFFDLKERRQKNRHGDFDDNSKELLETMHELAHGVYKEARRSVFQPEQKERYSHLENIVIDTTQKTGAKVDFSILYRDKKRTGREDTHADEQLAATALYLSSVAERKCGIITSDSDIRRILVYSLKDPRLANISDLVGKNRIRIYKPEDIATIRLDFDTLGFKL